VPEPEFPEERGRFNRTGPETGPVKTKPRSSDADLQAVIEAWPTLPDAIRAGILAMIRASR